MRARLSPNRALLAWAVLVAILPPCAPVFGQRKDQELLEEKIAKCTTYESIIQTDARIAYCTAIIDANVQPGIKATAFLHRGVARRDKGELERALADFSEAIDLFPPYAAAFVDRGVTYSQMKVYERAISDFDRAIVLMPSLPDAYQHRGDAVRVDRRDAKASRESSPFAGPTSYTRSRAANL
jgi:tetratricopeptide (TPR) repeat protein